MMLGTLPVLSARLCFVACVCACLRMCVPFRAFVCACVRAFLLFVCLFLCFGVVLRVCVFLCGALVVVFVGILGHI